MRTVGHGTEHKKLIGKMATSKHVLYCKGTWDTVARQQDILTGEAPPCGRYEHYDVYCMYIASPFLRKTRRVYFQ